jgi:hypothetical protein
VDEIIVNTNRVFLNSGVHVRLKLQCLKLFYDGKPEGKMNAWDMCKRFGKWKSNVKSILGECDNLMGAATLTIFQW